MSSIPHLTFVAVTLITIIAVTGLEMDTMPDIVYLSYEQDFGMKSGRYYRIKPSESNPTQLLAPVGYSADEPLIGQESKILRSTDGWEMYSGEELVGTKSVPNVMEKDQFGLFEKAVSWRIKAQKSFSGDSANQGEAAESNVWMEDETVSVSDATGIRPTIRDYVRHPGEINYILTDDIPMTMLDGQGEGDYEDDPSVQGHLVRSSGGPVHQQEKVVGYPEDKEQHRDDTAHLKEDLAEFEAESEEVVEHSDSGDLSSPPPISSGAARSGM